MLVRSALAGAAVLALAAPAFAQPALPPPPPGVVDAAGNVYDGPMPPHGARPMGHPGMPAQPGYDVAAWEQAKANWLAECRRRHGSDRKVGGAVIGGIVGGVVGNRVAGRGNRTVGTVTGAAVGAVAGGAIGDAADKRAARDYCEAYLEQNTSWGPNYAHGQGVVGYGYAPMTVMVPVAYVAVAAPAPARECVETVVTEEWVEVSRPQRARSIPPRPRPRAVPDKRVKIVPDKRVRTN